MQKFIAGFIVDISFFYVWIFTASQILHGYADYKLKLTQLLVLTKPTGVNII